MMRRNPSIIQPPGWMKKFLKQHKDVLVRKLRIDSEFQVLGCGHYGCVFPTEDSRWVVKISRDPTEGPLVQRIMAFRDSATGNQGRGPTWALDGIVFFKDLYEAGTVEFRGKTWPVYLIVREAINPRGSAFVRDSARGWKASRDVMDAARAYFRYKTPWRRDQARRKYGDALARMQGWFPHVGQTMFDLLDEEDLILQDVHMNNLGASVVDWDSPDIRTPGTVVIHDLGHTPTEPVGAFEPLGNPYWR